MNSTEQRTAVNVPPGLTERKPLLWINPRYITDQESGPVPDLDPQVAIERFERCAKLLARLYPELALTHGHVESRLDPLDGIQRHMHAPQGRWLLKRDDALPVAGSIKARGGFHEVLGWAESLALAEGIFRGQDDRAVMASPEARTLFSKYELAVGSTGNLGLSIGLIAKGLGFTATVHMSADAKQWKKQRLREQGVNVVEHAGDYAAAVAAGRALAQADPHCHFVDDEHSADLFLGYAAAAQELQRQLQAQAIAVDAAHPLFVYLPCGVGGAPGGIAYGLKCLFGPNVHCFFAEPVASPCMLLQLAQDDGCAVSVYDIGLDNVTEADGLAVAQASPLVAPLMAPRLSGVFTVDDDTLFLDTHALAVIQGIRIEPSAAAGMRGPIWLQHSAEGQDYLARHGLSAQMDAATHVIWATGGSLVPATEHDAFQARGRMLHQKGQSLLNKAS